MKYEINTDAASLVVDFPRVTISFDFGKISLEQIQRLHSVVLENWHKWQEHLKAQN